MDELEHVKSKSIILENTHNSLKFSTPDSFCKNCDKNKDMFFMSFPVKTTMCYDC